MKFRRLRAAFQSLYSSAPHDAPTTPSKNKAGELQADLSPNTAKIPSPFRNHPALQPIHLKPAISLLSLGERVEHAEPRTVNFRGILNLFFIILFVLNIRLVVENLIRYGPLMRLPRVGLFDSPLIFFGYLLVFSLPYLSFVSERYIAGKSRFAANTLQATLVLGTLVAPYAIVVSSDIHPLRSLILLMASMVYAMKIISYWHCCSDLYALRESNELKSLSAPESASEIEAANIAAAKAYPLCLSGAQMYKFVAYPTLVFQLVYPRTAEIRKRIVVRYLVELVFCVLLQFILIEQYITPILTNTIKGVEKRIEDKDNVVSFSWFLLERLLKLSIPNLYIWLLMFAELFHCWLNILAEVTKFGDRKFYLDWWNATSIRDYWQKWNQPVHHWLLRHLYKPLRKAGMSGSTAGLLVFVFSGVIHEYLIITPIGAPWNGSVTLGFILQLPLIILTDTELIKSRPTLGNCMFWITSCFTGQPLAVLIHFIAVSSPTVVPRVFSWIVYGAEGEL